MSILSPAKIAAMLVKRELFWQIKASLTFAPHALLESLLEAAQRLIVKDASLAHQVLLLSHFVSYFSRSLLSIFLVVLVVLMFSLLFLCLAGRFSDANATSCKPCKNESLRSGSVEGSEQCRRSCSMTSAMGVAGGYWGEVCKDYLSDGNSKFSLGIVGVMTAGAFIVLASTVQETYFYQ